MCPGSQTDAAAAPHMDGSSDFAVAWKEGHVMISTSDIPWVLIHSTLVAVFMLAWAYVPA